MKRHQLKHHQNEDCFARLNCTKCGLDYIRGFPHTVDECLTNLGRRCSALEKERSDQALLIKKLKRRLENKVDKSFIHLLVNDPDAAREQINQQMGGIRISPRKPEKIIEPASAFREFTQRSIQ